MLAVLRIVHRQQAVVDSLRIEEPLLGANQRIGPARAVGVAERALRVGDVTERLRKRIQISAALRRGKRARPIAAGSKELRLKEQRHRVIGIDAQRFVELRGRGGRIAGLECQLPVAHVIPRARVGRHADHPIDQRRRLRHLHSRSRKAAGQLVVAGANRHPGRIEAPDPSGAREYVRPVRSDPTPSGSRPSARGRRR